MRDILHRHTQSLREDDSSSLRVDTEQVSVMAARDYGVDNSRIDAFIRVPCSNYSYLVACFLTLRYIIFQGRWCHPLYIESVEQ